MNRRKLTGVALALVSLTSCSYASKEDLAEVRAEAQQSRKVSEQALRAAQDAKADADLAKQQAQESTTVSRQTEEVVNRSYKKAMYK